MSGNLGMRWVGRRPGWVLALCFGGMLVLILGCAASPARQDYFYRVEVQSPSSSSGACRLPGTLAVDRFESDVLTDGRQIVYQKDAGSPELGRYAFHLWSNPPSQLLSQQLASYLGKRGVADQVLGEGETSVHARICSVAASSRTGQSYNETPPRVNGGVSLG